MKIFECSKCKWKGSKSEMDSFPNSEDRMHYYCPHCKFHFFEPCIHRYHRGRCTICGVRMDFDIRKRNYED